MTRSAALTPLENLKGFATNRPPLIVFMVSIGLIALVLMSLAFYIKDSELKSPDITQDWNVFLESITEMEFCIQNGTLPAVATPSDQSVFLTSPSVSSTVSTVSSSSWSAQGVMKNYSVLMVLAIQPTIEFVSIPHNLTYLTGNIDASDIGLKGIAANEKVSISVQLPYEWNTTRCRKSLHKKCDVVNIYTCVTIQAYDFVFPVTKGPLTCEALNNTGIEYHAYMTAYKPKIYSTYRCRARPVMRVQYKLDPRLTVLLSLSDKSLINLHLLHTSYFLFVMTVTLLIYAMLRGRPVKLMMSNTKTLPLTANTEI